MPRTGHAAVERIGVLVDTDLAVVVWHAVGVRTIRQVRDQAEHAWVLAHQLNRVGLHRRYRACGYPQRHRDAGSPRPGGGALLCTHDGHRIAGARSAFDDLAQRRGDGAVLDHQQEVIPYRSDHRKQAAVRDRHVYGRGERGDVRQEGRAGVVGEEYAHDTQMTPPLFQATPALAGRLFGRRFQ